MKCSASCAIIVCLLTRINELPNQSIFGMHEFPLTWIHVSFTWSIYVWELAPQKFFSGHEPEKINLSNIAFLFPIVHNVNGIYLSTCKVGNIEYTWDDDRLFKIWDKFVSQCKKTCRRSEARLSACAVSWSLGQAWPNRWPLKEDCLIIS